MSNKQIIQQLLYRLIMNKQNILQNQLPADFELEKNLMKMDCQLMPIKQNFLKNICRVVLNNQNIVQNLLPAYVEWASCLPSDVE